MSPTDTSQVESMAFWLVVTAKVVEKVVETGVRHSYIASKSENTAGAVNTTSQIALERALAYCVNFLGSTPAERVITVVGNSLQICGLGAVAVAYFASNPVDGAIGAGGYLLGLGLCLGSSKISQYITNSSASLQAKFPKT